MKGLASEGNKCNRKEEQEKEIRISSTYLMLSVEKLTMLEMKFSLVKMDRITFQSVVASPNKRQMDSRAILTGVGGFAMDFTSTKFCFLIDCTAGHHIELDASHDTIHYTKSNKNK